MDLEHEFSDAICGVSIEKKPRSKIGLRARPWVEIRISNHKAKKIKYELLNYGISSTVNNAGIRIQGITNCDMITRFFNQPDWWKQAMNMFRNKEHLEKEGMLRIVQLRSRNSNRTVSKWTIKKVVETLNKNA